MRLMGKLMVPPIHLSVYHWCTIALPVASWRFGGKKKRAVHVAVISCSGVIPSSLIAGKT